jgi:SAM-dependent methyltransferase
VLASNYGEARCRAWERAVWDVMTILVIGPTNVGKSTYIRHHLGSEKTYFGYELAHAEIPCNGVIHYNLLFMAPELLNSGDLTPEWDILAEPVFAKMLASGRIQRAVVLTAPLDELVDRAAARRINELDRNPSTYLSEMWSTVLTRVDLFAIYDRLFDALEKAAIPVEVLYAASSPELEFSFLPSDQVYVHHNLGGRHVEGRPSLEDVEKVVALQGAEYQSVQLPHGLRTLPRGFGHVADRRRETFSLLNEHSRFHGRSVLDVGCAVGEMLFRAERRGAKRLVGIEMKPLRHNAAVEIGKLLATDAKFVAGDFLKLDIKEQFDDVLVLNVLHHVSDFRSFLLKAASLTRDRLVVEYPTLCDPLFLSLGPFQGLSVQHLPIVGVSSSNRDQTFVYTRAAIERIVNDAAPFNSQCMPSPIDGRELLILTKKSP